jgi:hypothetical protein
LACLLSSAGRACGGADGSVIGGWALLSRRPFGPTSLRPQQMTRTGHAQTTARGLASSAHSGAAVHRPVASPRRLGCAGFHRLPTRGAPASHGPRAHGLCPGALAGCSRLPRRPRILGALRARSAAQDRPSVGREAPGREPPDRFRRSPVICCACPAEPPCERESCSPWTESLGPRAGDP